MQCDMIAEDLTKRGHQVLYATPMRKHDSDYESLNYPVVFLDLTAKEQLSHLIRTFKPDVIYWRWNRKYVKRAIDEADKLDVPFIFAVSNVKDTIPYSLLSDVRGEIQDRRIFCNPVKSFRSLLFNYQRLHGSGTALSKVNCVVVNNRDHLGILPVSRQVSIRNAGSIVSSPFSWHNPYCLWVANLKERKRPEIYFDIVKQMETLEPDIDFLMIGEIHSHSYEEVYDLSRQQSNFHYLGFQPQDIVNGAIQGAECLVHTCEPEGFPNVYIQAWLAGIPVVTYEFDPEGFIVNDNLGYVSQSVEKMVTDIQSILHSETYHPSDRDRIKEFAEQVFGRKRLINEVEQLLMETIHPSRKSDEV